MHWILSAIAFHSDWFGTVVKGDKRTLVRDGEIQWDAMKKSHISQNDLEEAIRSNGNPPDISQIEKAFLERNGDISIIFRNRRANNQE